MSQRISITVSTALESVRECGGNSVSPEDYTAADMSPDDLADALVRLVERKAETARYAHKPRRAVSETTGRDYSTPDPE